MNAVSFRLRLYHEKIEDPWFLIVILADLDVASHCAIVHP